MCICAFFAVVTPCCENYQKSENGTLRISLSDENVVFIQINTIYLLIHNRNTVIKTTLLFPCRGALVTGQQEGKGHDRGKIPCVGINQPSTVSLLHLCLGAFQGNALLATGLQIGYISLSQFAPKFHLCLEQLRDICFILRAIGPKKVLW